ncbi:prostacyclin synthase [Stagonosporopsis vannaccii]|nr:prostacyclin synthase [Stagonosporopsis vannaccii]
MNLRWLIEFAAKIDPISSRKVIVDPDNAGKEKVGKNGIFELRVYEEAVPYFSMAFFPYLTIPQAYRAREQVQATMSKYYTEGHHVSDPTTATVTKNRADVLTKYGFTGEEIGLLECILPVVSTLNTVPTLYWFLLYILPQPSLMEKLREEIGASVEISEPDSTGVKTVTMDIAKFESELPLLVSCYRETLRLANHSVCSRRILEDMTVTDQNGQSYLFKKGVDIQLPAGVTHRDTRSWGSDAVQFRADRFLASTSKITDADRARKAAYMPFGNGRHLCPGRNFAFAEIVACVAVLVLGFDIEATGMKFEDMKMRAPRLSSSTVKPVDNGKGLGAIIKPREDFVNVVWKFRA